MGKNLLVINVDIRETRVALIENGIIAELHLERESSKGCLGNIYLGKVSRVLPGMQAAFIDVGLERAAFLHVEDLIRPDDFEAYLAGHHRHGEEERATRRASARRDSERPEAELTERDTSPTAEREPEAGPADLSIDEGRDTALAGPSIELPTALDVLGGPAAEAFAGMDDLEPLPDERDDQARMAEEGAIGDADAVDASDDGEPDDELASEPDDELAAEAEDELASEADEPVGEADDELAGEVDDELTGEADDELSGTDIADASSEDVEDVDVEDVDVPAYEVTPAPPLYEEAAIATEERADASAAEEAAIGVSGVEPGPDEGSAEVVSGGAIVEAMARAQEAPSPSDEIVQVPRARSGRALRLRRDGRVRRSGRTRDRSAAIGAEEAPAEAPRETRERGGRGQGGRDGRDRDQRGRDQRGRDQRGRERGRGEQASRDAKGRGSGRGQPQGARQRQNEPPRISKSTPIRDVIREGQDVLVQISKEPIGTKGARVTSHISLPGRYVVYLPTVDHIGISKRIGSEKERSRLRESIEAMKPPQGGLIVRTLAEGLTKKQLKADVGYLVRLWGEVVKKRESGVKAPTVLYTELDLVLKTARDLFTDDIEKIVIDDRDEYLRLRRFVEMFMPERAEAVELYEGTEPIFDAYGIEDEIQRALARKVPLKSGGHLIIDQAEALTAIDVNTGRFVGKGSKDLEETILTTNLEAVEEIAYQLRFRNIGGLIILDLIDMERAQNREKVRKRLEELLGRDKAKTTLNRISDLGLIEMTRKRTRESLGRIILEPCFYCDGTGQLQSKQTIAYEILRQIRRERMNLPGYSVVVNAHPAVIDLLKNDERIAVQEAERQFQRRIDLVPRKEYHLEQFDLQGR